MVALYIFLAIVFGGPLALLGGAIWKLATYPMKKVEYVNEWGNPRVKLVPDTDYHYKPHELWEAPPYWKNWQKNDLIPTTVDHGIEINHHGDDDWHNEQHV